MAEPIASRFLPIRLVAATASLFRDVAGRSTGVLALVLLGGLLLAITVGPVLVADPSAQAVARRLEGPSLEYLLGTDHLGRDLLARVVVGARIALAVAVPSVVSAMILGLVFGLAAGYLGGWVDKVAVVVTDALQAFPAVILALAFLALLGPSPTNVVIVIALGFAPGYVRVARASVFAIRQNVFVEAERSLAASDLRMITVHILPNVVAPILILMAIDLPVAVTIEAGLSFLGLGVPPPTPSWGVILSDGFARVRDTPWPVIWPSLALILTTLGFTLFGEALRDRLDPTVRNMRRGRV
jgi:peptide/nickel transport system permease protein